MPKPQTSRKARFRAALGFAGMTATDFARENDVTLTHLNGVLDETRESMKLTAKIDEFTRTHLKALQAAQHA